MLNICQVSTRNNIDIIIENYKNFKKKYDNLSFYLICPKKDFEFFIDKLDVYNFHIIDEEKIISFDDFRKKANSILIKSLFYQEIQTRLNWYYQQILKLSFVINFVDENKENIIIWDADTVIIKKIKFFINQKSIPFGSTAEFFKSYYETNKIIFGKLPKYFISSLTQFAAVSVEDNFNLVKDLNKNYPRSFNESLPDWLIRIIFSSIIKAHINYNGSLFSEYELIGQSKLINYDFKQKLVSGIREGLSGRLKNYQKKILYLLNYSYFAYELNHYESDAFKIGFVENKIFFHLILRKTSNKIFRGLKHQFYKWIN